jgi:16S rRNA (guanine527-N7)-methyltransferase
MNLTAITDIEQVIIKHFIDSLLVVQKIDLNNLKKMIDVGTGAGFPGIPIKIMFPDLNITLVDSLNKRLKFINEVIDELKLENIDTVHGRAEDIAKENEYREKYDLCVSRAVANLSTLSEYCIPFIKLNGIFVSYKSEYSQEEIIKSKKAISVLGGKIIAKEKIKLPYTDINRSFIIIKKTDNTPRVYPRKAGIPSKKPIE